MKEKDARGDGGTAARVADEGTTGVSDDDLRPRTAMLEAQAAELRRRLDELLHELNRQRHRALWARADVRRYSLLAAVALVGTGGLAFVSWRQRRRGWATLPRRLSAAMGGASPRVVRSLTK